MSVYGPNAKPLPAAEIAAGLIARFGDRVTAHLGDKHPRVHLPGELWHDVAAYLKTEPTLAFDWLACLSGMDYAADGTMAIVADLWSTRHGHRFAVKAFCPRDNPTLQTVTDLWKTADWHEREAYDLVGIHFSGHPNLVRILMDDDWAGHPLRKDYVFPRQVHGIPGSVELDWQQKP